MTPDRFQDAKRIYNSALEREPAEREAYLAEACAGDESLKQEVESLLGCRTEAQEFFKAPAVEAGAKALASESPIDFTGRTVSHYAVVEKIGEGFVVRWSPCRCASPPPPTSPPADGFPAAAPVPR